MHPIPGFLREAGQVIRIAGVVAVYEVYGQAESEDRVQGGWRYEVAAVQNGLGAE